MKELIKSSALHAGDSIAAISCCHGWAGDNDVRWKYELGVRRLNEIGLNVIAAPNSLKGSSYLSANPQARAEDFMWAFENKEIKAVIANIGGNDCIKIIPYIDASVIKTNPKIFLGMSDVTNLHLFCYQNGLATFYADNLLNSISEPSGWHKYSRFWFEKILFGGSEIGLIEAADEWTCESINYSNPSRTRTYRKSSGYKLIQGAGTVSGKLFGGCTDPLGFESAWQWLSASDFENTILFIESIPQFFTSKHIVEFLNWLDQIGGLRKINGIIIGKAAELTDFAEQSRAIKEFLGDKGLSDLPILYGLNFGHSSPTCILPYGAKAEINCERLTFSINECVVEFL